MPTYRLRRRKPRDRVVEIAPDLRARWARAHLILRERLGRLCPDGDYRPVLTDDELAHLRAAQRREDEAQRAGGAS